MGSLPFHFRKRLRSGDKTERGWYTGYTLSPRSVAEIALYADSRQGCSEPREARF